MTHCRFITASICHSFKFWALFPMVGHAIITSIHTRSSFTICPAPVLEAWSDSLAAQCDIPLHTDRESVKLQLHVWKSWKKCWLSTASAEELVAGKSGGRSLYVSNHLRSLWVKESDSAFRVQTAEDSYQQCRWIYRGARISDARASTCRHRASLQPRPSCPRVSAILWGVTLCVVIIHSHLFPSEPAAPAVLL